MMKKMGVIKAAAQKKDNKKKQIKQVKAC